MPTAPSSTLELARRKMAVDEGRYVERAPTAASSPSC
jgi:hypothetical protein